MGCQCTSVACSVPHGLLTCCMAAPLAECMSQKHEAVIALSLRQQQVLRSCWGCTTGLSALRGRAKGRLPGPAFILPIQMCCNSKPFPLLRRDCSVNLMWPSPSLWHRPVPQLCSVIWGGTFVPWGGYRRLGTVVGVHRGPASCLPLRQLGGGVLALLYGMLRLA